MSVVQGLRFPPLSVYIHIPWCVRKCPYCDFNSHTKPDSLPESAYLAALSEDLRFALPQVEGRTVHSIFFGGGTPSVFSAAAIQQIIRELQAALPMAEDIEITLEANPGTWDESQFAGYREAGVNRLSLGVQSFNNNHLTRLGRIHDVQQALQAAETATKLFNQVNLDLMYGLPEQTLADALDTVEQACRLKPGHLSCYHLTLEPNTPFYHTPPPLPGEDLCADMQLAIEEMLANQGYQHYEVSAFAKAGQRCRHNLNYWLFGDYLGLGAGAHSKLTQPHEVVRQARHKHPQYYMHSTSSAGHIAETRILSLDDLRFEFMMNALRLTGGFDKNLFNERTGLSWSDLEEMPDQAVARGLIIIKGGHVTPTLLGQRYLNDLLAIFLEEVN